MNENLNSFEMWGKNIECVKDVWNVFEKFCSGKPNNDGIQVEIFFLFRLKLFLCKLFYFQITKTFICDKVFDVDQSWVSTTLAKFSNEGILISNWLPNLHGAPSQETFFLFLPYF